MSESPLTLRAFPRKNGSGDELAQALGDLVLRERWHLQELREEEGRLDEVFRHITLGGNTPAEEEAK